jgi:hypothetical protein
VDCEGPTTTFKITVNPTPAVNAVPDQVICNNGATNAVKFSGAAATSFKWTNNTPGIGLAASGTGDIASFTATNSGSTAVTATITVTPHFTGGNVDCPGPSESFKIIVNPTPVVNAVTNQVICNDNPTSLVSFSGAGATGFTWTNDNTSIGLAASGTGNIASFTTSNTGSAPVTATITVTPHFVGNNVDCPGVPKTFTITVNPTPHSNAIGNQVICSGSPVSAINFSGTGVTSYTWTNSTPSIGLAAVGIGDISSFTALNSSSVPVTATITVTPHFTGGSVDCEGPTKTFTIIVDPLPVASISGATAVCQGTPSPDITFTGSNGKAPYTFIYKINNGPNISVSTTASNNSVTVPAPTGTVGDFTYELVSLYDSITKRCSNLATGSAKVTIYELPAVPTFLNAVGTICKNTKGVPFEVSNGSSKVTTYHWSTNPPMNMVSKDGRTIIDFPDQTGDVQVKMTYTNANGCTRSDSFKVTVTSNQAPGRGKVVRRPDSTLVILDNSAASYQWGADNVTTLESDTFAGEIYQDYDPKTFEPSKYHYWVLTSNAAGCLTKSYYNAPTMTGFDEPGRLPFRTTIFPNPNNGSFVVRIEGENTGLIRVQIIDLLGNIIHATTERKSAGRMDLPLNLGTCKPGMYFLKLGEGTETVTQKIIIK